MLLISGPAFAVDPPEPDDTEGIGLSEDVDTGGKALRRLRFTVAGMSAITALVDATDTWEFSFGGAVGVTKSGPGLGGFLQIGYLGPTNHWSHAIPIDFGGQYRWGSHVKSVFVSGGMSFIAVEPRRGILADGIFTLGKDWEVVPLIYMDVGGRIMFHPAIGLDFKLEARTYWVVNIISLKVSVVF